MEIEYVPFKDSLESDKKFWSHFLNLKLYKLTVSCQTAVMLVLKILQIPRFVTGSGVNFKQGFIRLKLGSTQKITGVKVLKLTFHPL